MFIVEAVIKILGFGWQFYIRSGWNKFDFVLVAASVIDLVMSAVGSSVGGSIFNILRSQKILRVTRITRMLKLIKSFKSLQSLFVTLWISLPAFWNVGALLLLIMFVYSYLGVQLLGNLRHRESINEHANFERFWMAMLTLFRSASCRHRRRHLAVPRTPRGAGWPLFRGAVGVVAVGRALTVWHVAQHTVLPFPCGHAWTRCAQDWSWNWHPTLRLFLESLVAL